MKPQLVGIIGGVGPMATVYFMEMFLNKTRAARDQDHLDMLVSNHATIPDRTDFLLGKSSESPLQAMIADAKTLQNAGCDFVVLPCNTAHYFFEAVQESIHIPLLNIIEETVKRCLAKVPQLRTIGVMATEGTIYTNTYALACEKYGLSCLYPGADVQKQVSSMIYDKVKAGKSVGKEEFLSVVNTLRKMGCGAIVLGCTELSVAFADLQLEQECPDVVDSLTVLAEQTILFAGKELKEEV